MSSFQQDAPDSNSLPPHQRHQPARNRHARIMHNGRSAYPPAARSGIPLVRERQRAPKCISWGFVEARGLHHSCRFLPAPLAMPRRLRSRMDALPAMLGLRRWQWWSRTANQLQRHAAAADLGLLVGYGGSVCADQSGSIRGNSSKLIVGFQGKGLCLALRPVSSMTGRCFASDSVAIKFAV